MLSVPLMPMVRKPGVRGEKEEDENLPGFRQSGAGRGIWSCFSFLPAAAFPWLWIPESFATAAKPSVAHKNSLLCTGMHFLQKKKKKKIIQERKVHPPVSQRAQVPPLTDTQSKFPGISPEAFLGWGLWGPCPPMACSRSGHCCQPRCCVMFQACSGSKSLFSNRSFLILHLQHRSREGICHTRSLLLQNGEAFQTAFWSQQGKELEELL